MLPWYKTVEPRDEVREGRSFNPDEFAIALEQVVAGTAPKDYSEPEKFFARTHFTRALQDHAGMVLRRLAGLTDQTAPVLTLVTQFGGGKTHTLTALYHLTRNGQAAARDPGVAELIAKADLSAVPGASVGVFVGNAWDPQDGRETPWIDLARQVAGAKGVEALGSAARSVPPGTDALGRVFETAGRPVLLLLDEVLNFVNRHRSMAEPFHAFLQNLTVATTGRKNAAAVISLPRSQIEMTDWDLQWQGKITKVVRRVAKDLIANDESEIAEVVRRRLFEELGTERTRKRVAREYADWCFERRAQLPPEWTSVDSSLTEAKAREVLQARFESCYPFHPATLSVFQRKWQALPQYQQTRGTLAMLAQWIYLARRDGYDKARREPLLTLGSAPLDETDFRSTVLGQIGESRLTAAIEADISGLHSHARVLDGDIQDRALKDLHRRVGTVIFFESSGGQVEKVAHLPELRFALGEPEIETTSIDNAALALEARAFFLRRIGSDGFQIRHQPTLRKVVNDRRASLDEESEVVPTMRNLVKEEFNRGATLPPVLVQEEGDEVGDSPRLTLAVLDPSIEWTDSGLVRERVAKWTRRRGQSDRLYPGALVWCVRKPGRDLRDRAELLLAWQRVDREIREGILGSDFERGELAEIRDRVRDAERDARDEVWASYRFAVIADREEDDGVRVIDLGAGHASSGETLWDRVIAALKSEALLNKSIGAGYLDRNWPDSFVESGAWPLTSLRQSFLNGSLTRLVDPDGVLRSKIVEFVAQGLFGLASGPREGGPYEHLWFEELVSPDEVEFASEVYLLKKEKAEAWKRGDVPVTPPRPEDAPTPPPHPREPDSPALPAEATPSAVAATRTIRLTGKVPPESWNRLGRMVIPKLRTAQGSDLGIRVVFQASVREDLAPSVESDLRRILEDLGLSDDLSLE